MRLSDSLTTKTFVNLYVNLTYIEFCDKVIHMYSTISARQIQREYKRVLEMANTNTEPIVVMANNKPQGAVIGLDLLERIQLEMTLKNALMEYKARKTKSISNFSELEADFIQMRVEAGLK